MTGSCTSDVVDDAEYRSCYPLNLDLGLVSELKLLGIALYIICLPLQHELHLLPLERPHWEHGCESGTYILTDETLVLVNKFWVILPYIFKGKLNSISLIILARVFILIEPNIESYGQSPYIPEFIDRHIRGLEHNGPRHRLGLCDWNLVVGL